MMAHLRNTNKNQNALCYLWLTFSLLLVTVVCFGISTTQSAALYAGVVFLILTSLSAIFYISSNCAQRSNPDGDGCCETYCSCCVLCCPCCYVGGCCYNAVSRCMRKVLCLPPREDYNRHSRHLSLTRRDRLRLSASAGIVVVTSSGERVIIQQTPAAAAAAAPAAVQRRVSTSRLRAVEQELQLLFQEYSFLQTDAVTATNLVLDYSRMEYENGRLIKWIEGQERPSEEQFRDMRQALKKVKRNFRIARRRLSQDSSVRADMGIDIVLHDPPSTIHHQVMMYASDVREPPSYQEHDPLPTSQTNTSLPSNNSSNNSQNCSSGYSVRPSGFNSEFSSDNYYVNRLSSHMTGSVPSLAPPMDETGAPPTYEEATSSTV